jgi:uncharacterized protein
MNKPATREPSMDEILSSIRQIIADDDATAPRPPQSSLPVMPPPADDTMSGFHDEPLTLSKAQIFGDPPPAPKPIDFGSFLADADAEEEADEPGLEANFIDPEDITFEGEPPPAPTPPPIPPRSITPPPAAAARPAFVAPPPPSTPPPARPRPSPAEAAPMPDPDLSRDITEQLLEPAADALVRANFAKLNNLGLGNAGLTIEAMMREMLRPMLKEWLDEHLPTVVERMVEREITRISRGVE